MNTPFPDSNAADRLGLTDGNGRPADAPLRRTSSGFLAAGYNGFGDVPAVTEVFLEGLTSENSDGGALYVEVDAPYGDVWVRRRAHDDPYRTPDDDLLVAPDFIMSWPATLLLTGTESHPELSGRIRFAAEPPEEFRLFVPLSSTETHVIEDTFYNLSSLELRGVTAANSDNGALTWSVEPYGYGYVRLSLANPAAAGVKVAAAVVADDSPFPCRCVLDPRNGSGITGSATLETFSTGTGRLVTRVADGLNLDPGVDLVVPRLAGTGTRPLGVDAAGRLVAL